MRAPRPLGALVASSFFALAKAQANAYGDPTDNGIPGQNGSPDGWHPPSGNGAPLPSGNPGDWQNPAGNGLPVPSGNPGDWQIPSGTGNVPSTGSSGSWPNAGGAPSSPGNSGGWPNGDGVPGLPSDGVPGNGFPGNTSPSPDGNSGTWPNGASPSGSGNPGDWPNPDSSNAPAASEGPSEWPHDPACVMQGTTTIFVTVLPSSPATSSPSGVTSPDGSSPDGSNPDGSDDGTSPSNGGNPDDGSVPGGTSSSGAPSYGSSDGTSPDGDLSAGSSPGVSSPDGSSPATPESSHPVDKGSGAPQGQSSADAGQVTNGPVKPFTTLTIDIWGTGGAPATVASDSSPQATSGDSSVVTDAPAPLPNGPINSGLDQSGSKPGSAPEPNSDGTNSGEPGDASGNGPTPNPADSAVPGSGDPSSGPEPSGSPYPDDDSYGHPGESPVFVTDGKPGPSGVNQNSPPQPQITSADNTSSGPSDSTGNSDGNYQDGQAPYSVTIIGPDGQPTIVSHPWGHGSQAGHQPLPTDIYASGADAQTLPNPVSVGVTLSPPTATNAGVPGPAGSDADDSGVVTCVTIIGSDGKPTVVDFTAGIPGTDATAWPLSVTAITDGSALAQSITIIGADGKPTVIGSPWDNPNTPADPFPAVTSVPGPAGNGNANGDGGIVTSDAQLPDGATTCVTVLGSDGKPTIVDWPWNYPGLSSTSGPVATVAPFPGNNGNGNGGVVTDASALPQVGPMTQASFTILGPDGVPTVIETTWAASPTQAGSGPGQGPVISQASISGLPPGISVQLPLPSGTGPDGSSGPGDGTTTCFTIVGADGKPTVVETTLAAPGVTGGPVVGPGATLIPSSASDALSIPLPPFPDTASQALPGGGAGSNAGDAPYTTCTSYTVLGPDGLPTVVDTTWVVPPAFQTGSALATDASGPLSGPAGQVTGVPGSPDANGAGGITTCSTYTIIGPDGIPSAIETTFVVPSEASGALATDAHLTSGIQAAPWSAASAGPAPPSAGSNAPSAGSGSDGGGSDGGGPLTTCITVMTTGTDGTLTPVEQTVILPPASGVGLPSGITDQSALPMATAGLPGSLPTGPIIDNGSSSPGDNGDSNISGYNGADPANGDAGTIAPPGGPIFSRASADPVTAGEPTITVTGTRTSTMIVIADPSGGPVITGPSGLPLSEYGAGGGAGEPLPATAQAPGDGSLPEPSESTLFPAGSVAYGNANAAGVPVTSTWSNEVPEGTTTHLLKFPLTTLATLPIKRALRRQASAPAWNNSSTIASSATSSQADASPVPSMCATGGNIGNRTVNFDNEKPGPLFNPSNDLWFSEGFLIAPPSSQDEQSYFASSGGQLVEFVPASLTPASDADGSDIAEVGVGPNASKECYRFDLFGASLGCAAEGPEEWCEFDISAYRWNHETSREESIEWSETKRVPACANFPSGSCALTPIELDGYANITGVLITLRVGLDLRAWWGDDFRYGWTDNSCEAAICRSSAATHRVKRETVETALRRGVWHWTPVGVERLDDDFIWDAVQ